MATYCPYCCASISTRAMIARHNEACAETGERSYPVPRLPLVKQPDPRFLRTPLSRYPRTQ